MQMTILMIDTYISVRYLNANSYLVAAHSEINKAWGVIYPDATFKGMWDLLGLLFIIYQSIVIPFRLCFDMNA